MGLVMIDDRVLKAMKQTKDYALTYPEYEVLYGFRDTLKKWLGIQAKLIQIGISDGNYIGKEGEAYAAIAHLQKMIDEVKQLRAPETYEKGEK